MEQTPSKNPIVIGRCTSN